MTESAENTLLEVRPAMFRNHPILFWPALACLAIPLIIWWISNKGTTLTVTDRRTILRRGLLSKHTTEVMHSDIRNVQIDQGIIQRMMGVGTISISSAGQSDVEISVSGVKDPEGIKGMIDQHR